MKVLMVSTQYPYPKDNGKKIILSTILEYFIDRYGAENVEYMILGDNKLPNKTNITVKAFKKSNTKNQLKNVLLYSALFRRKSIQEALLYNEEARLEIHNYIEEKNFDIVIYDTIRVSQLFEKSKFKSTKEFVYLDDLFSIRYEKILQSMKEYPHIKFNVIGNFSKFLPKFARKLVTFDHLNKRLLKFEKQIIHKREVETAKCYEGSLLISQKEADLLNEWAGLDSVQSIRPLVVNKDLPYFRNITSQPKFIFLGALNIPHNDVSICNFLTKNMNTLIKEIPSVKIQIIGKNASDDLINIVKKYSNNIELLGFVEDLDEIFSQASAMIVPLLFGSGVKIKTLEAFARGLPIIATEFGVEGINLPRNGECIVEDRVENYTSHMKRLSDQSENEKMSQLALEFFKDFYSKEAVFKQYDDIFTV
jgi:glycosyltransferase involved in cell wall biosynthesis